jgi:eukaryotic-like serine/threonine-protein kinase
MWSASPPIACDTIDPHADRVFSSDRYREIQTAVRTTNAVNAEATAAAIEARLEAYRQRWHATRAESCRATVEGKQSPELGARQRSCLEQRLEYVEALTTVLGTISDAKTAIRAASVVEQLPEVEACTRPDLPLTEPDPPMPLVAGRVRQIEARTTRIRMLQNTGQFQRASQEIDAVVADARGTGYPAIISRALIAQADTLEGLGKYDQLETILDEAARQAATSRDDYLAAEAWIERVGAVGTHFARYADGHKWASAADVAVLRAGNPPWLRSLLQLHVAALWLEQGEVAKAHAEAQAAIALREQFFPDRPAAIADARNILAVTLQREGKFDEARVQYDKALAEYRAVYGEDHPRIADFLSNIGYLLLESARPREALVPLNKAIEIGERLIGPDAFVVGHAITTIGLARLAIGEYDTAMSLFRRAEAIMRKKFDANNPRVGYAIGNIGLAAQRLGDYPAAIKAYTEALDIFVKAFGAKHAMVAQAHASLGQSWFAAGDLRRAESELDHAIELFSMSGGDNRGEEASARIVLAQLHASRGRFAEARAGFALAKSALGPEHATTVLATAGVVYCDAVMRRVTRTQVDELETMVTGARTDDMEPGELGFLAVARARAHAAFRERTRARQLAIVSREHYAKANLVAGIREVDRLLKELP